MDFLTEVSVRDKMTAMSKLSMVEKFTVVAKSRDVRNYVESSVGLPVVTLTFLLACLIPISIKRLLTNERIDTDIYTAFVLYAIVQFVWLGVRHQHFQDVRRITQCDISFLENRKFCALFKDSCQRFFGAFVAPTLTEHQMLSDSPQRQKESIRYLAATIFSTPHQERVLSEPAPAAYTRQPITF